MVLRSCRPAGWRWNLAHEFDRMLHDLWPLGEAPMATARAFPPLNVWEEGETLYCEAELPGVAQDSLEVAVEGNQLSLKGQRSSHAGEQATYLSRERGQGQFTRVVRLPYPVDSQNVSASLRDGVLLISLPKAAEHRARKIQVAGNAS